jgi:hypothetical protein
LFIFVRRMRWSALYAGQLTERAPDIANQLLLAGSAADAGRCVRFLLLAGDRALAAGAFEDARAHFDHALALLPAGTGRQGADARFRRGLAIRGPGAWGRRWFHSVSRWMSTPGSATRPRSGTCLRN